MTPILRGVLRMEASARDELAQEIGPFVAEYYAPERVAIRIPPGHWRRVIAMYRRPNRSHPPPKEIVIGLEEGLVTLVEAGMPPGAQGAAGPLKLGRDGAVPSPGADFTAGPEET